MSIALSPLKIIDRKKMLVKVSDFECFFTFALKLYEFIVFFGPNVSHIHKTLFTYLHNAHSIICHPIQHKKTINIPKLGLHVKT